MTSYWLGKHRAEGSKPPSRKGISPSPEARQKQREKMLGFKHSETTKKKISEGHIGITHPAWNKGISYKSKEEHWNWQGGITPLNKLLRCSAKWQIWRNQVFLRDNFTCQNPNCEFCHNLQGVKLHPHHIKLLSEYPELAFDIDNGITYCEDFHLKSGLHRRVDLLCKQTIKNGGSNLN